jgi:hypothetical protein
MKLSSFEKEHENKLIIHNLGEIKGQKKLGGYFDPSPEHLRRIGQRHC